MGVVALLAAALVAFAVAPALLPATYSLVEHGISESAAQGIDGAWLARMGFIGFGLAVIWLAQLRSRTWGWIGTLLHVGFGVCMLAVAAFSAKPWEENAPYVAIEESLHSLFATVMGFGFIIGVLAVMIARRLPSLRAALPDLVVIVIATAIPLMMSFNIWGLLQRVMFVTAAVWYGREALMRYAKQPPRPAEPS